MKCWQICWSPLACHFDSLANVCVLQPQKEVVAMAIHLGGAENSVNSFHRQQLHHSSYYLIDYLIVIWDLLKQILACLYIQSSF